MNEMVRMAVILTVLASVAGGVLAAVNNSTKDRIVKQQLAFVKGPAIKSIMEGSSNNPVEDYVVISGTDGDQTVFFGSFDDKPPAIAFEEFGKGFGGDIGVMVGFDLTSDTVKGVAVTVHNETPGLGAKAKESPDLVNQFKGMPLSSEVTVSKDGGQIDAISGATTTSRAVCAAVSKSMKTYRQLKPQLEKELEKSGN